MKGYKERLSNTFNGALAKAKTTISNSSGNIIQYRHSKTEQSHFEVEDDLLDQPNSGAAIQDLRELILEEERKEILQSSLATSLPQNSVFDENSIDFSLLVGGTSASTQTSVIHTEVLIVSATNKRDSGMPLPMHCSWYNVSRKKDPSKDEFTLIEGIYGSCYQPSIEDLGDKICVHAIPASDAQEYQGMPIFAEVGPLLMNPKIQDKASQLSTNLLDDFKADFQVSLEKLNTVNYPLTKCSMKLSKTSLTFLKGTDELHTLQISEYQLIIVRASNNKIELLNGGSVMASVSMRNNIERDVFALVYRDMQSRIFIEKEENLIVANPIDANSVKGNPVEGNPEVANPISNDSGFPAQQVKLQNEEQLLVVPKDDLDDEEVENMISENPFQFEDEKTVEVSPQQQDFTFPNPEPITEQINFDFQMPEQKSQNDETLHEKIKSLEQQVQSLEWQLQEAQNQQVENENLKVIEIESLKKQLELQKEAREDQERLIGELKEQNKVLEELDKGRNWIPFIFIKCQLYMNSKKLLSLQEFFIFLLKIFILMQKFIISQRLINTYEGNAEEMNAIQSFNQKQASTNKRSAYQPPKKNTYSKCYQIQKKLQFTQQKQILKQPTQRISNPSLRSSKMKTNGLYYLNFKKSQDVQMFIIEIYLIHLVLPSSLSILGISAFKLFQASSVRHTPFDENIISPFLSYTSLISTIFCPLKVLTNTFFLAFKSKNELPSLSFQAGTCFVGDDPNSLSSSSSVPLRSSLLGAYFSSFLISRFFVAMLSRFFIQSYLLKIYCNL